METNSEKMLEISGIDWQKETANTNYCGECDGQPKIMSCNGNCFFMTHGRTYNRSIQNRFDHIQKEMQKVVVAELLLAARKKELLAEFKKEEYQKYLQPTNPG